MVFEFDAAILGKAKVLRRKELMPQVIKFVAVVFVPALLLALLLLLAPAFEVTFVLFVQNFLAISTVIGIAYTIILIIQKQSNPFPFDKEIAPDIETSGIIYQHIIKSNNSGRKDAFVKVIVSDVNDFMYSRVPADKFLPGEIVAVSYDSKIVKGLKSCIVSERPDFSAIEKKDIEE